ncbi:MAG: 3-isopropylmalate dehydratase large subunit [Anaerolineae bacterium]
MAMTIAEKILARAAGRSEAHAGEFLTVHADRVLTNDIMTPVTEQALVAMGVKQLADPDRVVVVADHFVPPKDAMASDLLRKLREFAEKYEVGHFYDIGRGGIEHALLPQEGLVRPGDVIIGADSHTCTMGAYGAFGTGMGATDMAALMALGTTWLRVPETIRFEFCGQASPYFTGKDFILRALAETGVSGATYMAMEFGGEAVHRLNIDERAALCNLAVEGGAKTGLVDADAVTRAWADEHVPGQGVFLTPDAGATYAKVRRIDVSGLGPLVAVPFLPANVKPVGEVAGMKVVQVYLGNCANGTLTDLRQAASLLRGRRVAPGVRMIVVPATQRIYQQAMKEGLLDTFIEAGAAISMPTCGACFGGHNGVLAKDEAALATTNRNFRGRMGDPESRVYLANAYVAAATAIAGKIIDPSEVTQ